MPRDGEAQASCLYTGSVSHRRRKPVPHEFRYRVSFLLLDLGELGRLRDCFPLWRGTKNAILSFRREDHFGDPSRPLDLCVRELVEDHCGRRPEGPVRLLTCPRFLGYAFNPISLYFCYDRAGSTVEAVVAEVTNTPWLERHCYVLPVPSDRRGAAVQRFECAKELHVSPFLDMQQRYRWRIGMPGTRLSLHIENEKDGECIFDAQLSLRRLPLDLRSLLTCTLLAPFGAWRVVAAIHYQALKLWWKGAPYHPHPRYNASAAGTPTAGRTHESEDLHHEQHRAA